MPLPYILLPYKFHLPGILPLSFPTCPPSTFLIPTSPITTITVFITRDADFVIRNFLCFFTLDLEQDLSCLRKWLNSIENELRSVGEMRGVHWNQQQLQEKLQEHVVS